MRIRYVLALNLSLDDLRQTFLPLSWNGIFLNLKFTYLVTRSSLGGVNVFENSNLFWSLKSNDSFLKNTPNRAHQKIKYCTNFYFLKYISFSITVTIEGYLISRYFQWLHYFNFTLGSSNIQPRIIGSFSSRIFVKFLVDKIYFIKPK